MAAVSTKSTDWIHVETPEHGPIGEIIKAIANEIDNWTRGTEVVKDSIKVDYAGGLSLDAVGVLVDVYRESGESDGDYRSRLVNIVYTTETQTEDAIETEVRRITGAVPQVDTYPEVDFVTEYGMSKNNGIVRVLVPFNKWALYGGDIQGRLPAVVAAGIAIIAESYNRYFEEFYDTVLITDYILTHLTAYPPLTEEIFPNRVAIIGSAVIGTHLIGHWVETIYSLWDEGQWDEAKWDEGHVQVNITDLF